MGDYDFQLGNQFWLNTNAGAFAEQVNEASGTKVSKETTEKLSHLKEFNSAQFFAPGNNSFLKSAIGRAEIFAASHTLSEDQKMIHQFNARENERKLELNHDEFLMAIIQLVQNTRNDGGKIGSKEIPAGLEQYLETALDMLLNSEEFMLRAQENRALSEEGKLALMNSVLGVATLLQKGKISPDALLVLFDTKAYDLSTLSDMLKLTADCARKVKSNFIDSDSVENAITVCEDQIETLRHYKKGNSVKLIALEKRLEALKKAGETLIANRKKACSGIPDNCPLVDPEGKVDTKEFQETKLKEMRNYLRAFRYDLDLASNVKMGKRERLRRFFDDIHPTLPDSTSRITSEIFEELQKDTQEFNECLAALTDVIHEENKMAGIPKMQETKPLDLNRAISTATSLSHATNDRIRFHFAVDTKENDIHKDVQSELGSIVEHGGTRKVSLEVGLDFMIGLDPSFASMKVGAGTKFICDAEIFVPDGGGAITVTYSLGGDVHALASAHVGTASNDSTNPVGISAGATAKASAGGARSFSVTYATLDEFTLALQSKKVSPESLAINTGLGDIVLSAAKHGGEKVVGGIKLGLTKMQLRIDKTQGDNIAFSKQMESFGIFRNADIVRPRRRVAMKSASASYDSVYGGAETMAQVGFYADMYGHTRMNATAHAGAEAKVSTTLHIRRTTYTHFANVLKKSPLQEVERLFNQEITKPTQEIADSVKTIGRIVSTSITKKKIAGSFEELLAELNKMEQAAKGHSHDDKDFWESYAYCSRVLLAACVLLTKRGQGLSLEPADARSFASSLKAEENFLLDRIVNSPVDMPQEIFESILLHSSEFGEPAQICKSGKVEFGGEIHLPRPEMKLPGEDETGILERAAQLKEKSEKEVWKDTGNYIWRSEVNAVTDKLERDMSFDLLGNGGGISISYEVAKPLGQGKSSLPWKNHTLQTLNISISSSMPIRYAAGIIARQVVANLGGIDEGENEQLRQDIQKQILSTLVIDPLVTGLGTAFVPTLETSVGEFLHHTGLFSEKVNAAAIPKSPVSDYLPLKDPGKNAENLTSSAEQDSVKERKQTFSLNFCDDRFVGFALASESKTSQSKDLQCCGPLSLHFGIGFVQRRVDYTILSKPPIDTVLQCMNNMKYKGNDDMRRAFMTRNAKAMLRLLDEFKDESHAVDDFTKKDRSEIHERVTQARALLQKIDDENREVAQRLLQKLDKLLGQANTLPDDMSDLDKLKLAERLFMTLAAAFSLGAKAND